MLIIPDPATLEIRELDLPLHDLFENLAQRDFGGIETTLLDISLPQADTYNSLWR